LTEHGDVSEGPRALVLHWAPHRLGPALHKELHTLELTSKVTTEFAYNVISRGLHKERYC